MRPSFGASPPSPGTVRRGAAARPRLAGRQQVLAAYCRSVSSSGSASRRRAVVARSPATCPPGAQQVEHVAHASTAPRRRPPRRPPASSRRRRPPGGAGAARSGSVQQVVAPVQRRPQRLLARQRRPLPPVSSRKRSSSRAAICSTGSARTRAAASSSASGMPSSRAADLRHRRGVALGQREAGLAAPRPLDEQPHRLDCGQRALRAARVRRVAGSASEGTRQAVSPATPSASRLVARMREPRAGAQQRVGQRGARVDQVLAVVEHQQDTRAAADVIAQRGSQILAGPSRTPSAPPMVSRTRPASQTGARSTNQTPRA